MYNVGAGLNLPKDWSPPPNDRAVFPLLQLPRAWCVGIFSAIFSPHLPLPVPLSSLLLIAFESMRYTPSGSGRDYFIVCDDIQRFGKGGRPPAPNPFETRIFKESASEHVVLATESTTTSKPSVRPAMSGYSGYRPKYHGIDPIGKSYVDASASGEDTVSHPSKKEAFLKTMPRFDEEATQKRLGATRLSEVPRGNPGHSDPIAGYSGYRPRQISNYGSSEQ